MTTRKTCGALVAAILAACSTSSSGDSAPAPQPAADAGDSRIRLAPGDVVEVALTAGAGALTIATDASSEKYVVVAASSRFDTSGDPLAYAVTTDTAIATPSSVTPVRGCSIATDTWRSASVAPETAPTGTAVAEGTTKTLHASTRTGSENIEVKAVAVGKHAVVWADITPAHPATFDGDFVKQFLTDFENTILPRARSVFGVESDLDGDGHIALVFTPLTNQTAVAFFTGCDLAKWRGCRASNAGEYLWLTPPNAIKPPYNTPSAVREILSHELSHLIHFNRKVLRNNLKEWTDSGYMIEGLGGFAQDAIGPQAGNMYVTKAGLDGIATFSLGDVLVDETPYDTERDGVMRGGSYLFMRWLYDRAGSDDATPDGAIVGKGGPALLRALLDSPESVAHALPAATKAPIADIGMDFFTALAMSNRDLVGDASPANGCFSYLPLTTDPITDKPRGADVFQEFHGQRMMGPAMSKPKGTLRAGGVAYVEVTASGPQLDLSITVDDKAAPRVRVGRLR